MICATCKEEGVLSTALSQEFYYCRTCKKEITLEYVGDPSLGENLFDDIDYEDMTKEEKAEYDKWLDSIDFGKVMDDGDLQLSFNFVTYPKAYK